MRRDGLACSRGMMAMEAGENESLRDALTFIKDAICSEGEGEEKFTELRSVFTPGASIRIVSNNTEAVFNLDCLSRATRALRRDGCVWNDLVWVFEDEASEEVSVSVHMACSGELCEADHHIVGISFSISYRAPGCWAINSCKINGGNIVMDIDGGEFCCMK